MEKLWTVKISPWRDISPVNFTVKSTLYANAIFDTFDCVKRRLNEEMKIRIAQIDDYYWYEFKLSNFYLEVKTK